jgi:hypothetical protein
MGTCVGIAFALVIAVWIIANLLRKTEEQPVRPRPRARRSDLDRFLEEIEQRRRRAEEREAAPPTEEPPPVEPVRPRPAPRKIQPRPAPVVRRGPADLPARLRPAETAQPVILDVLPVSPPAAVSPSPPVVPVAPPPPAIAAPPPVSPPGVGGGYRGGPPQGRARVVELLRSPQALATAFLLHEILGPPLCRRRSPYPAKPS